MSARTPAEGRPEPEAPQPGNILAEIRGGDAPVLAETGFAGAAPKRKFNVQTIILVVVIAASAGMLYAMRRHGMGAGFTFQTVKIDYEWDSISPLTVAKQQRVLDDLARSGQPIKAPVDQLPKNPFVLDLSVAAPVVDPDVPAVDPGAEAARMAELNRKIREREIQTALATVQLQSVMDGRVPIARINGTFVRVGDTVADVFTVQAIHGRTVELAVDDRVFAVSMDDPMNDGARRRP